MGDKMFERKEKVTGGFNSRDISIVVEKIINGNLIQEVAHFIAKQDKTDSKSLVVINEDFDFKEELDFVENEIISTLKKQLEFKDKSKEEKLKIIRNSINNQLEIIKNIKKSEYGYKIDSNEEETAEEETDKKKKQEPTNIIDEENKLRVLQVLEQHIIDYDDKGVYEIINIEGMREIRFLLVGDFLFPLYRSPNNRTIYAGMVTKKKVYKVESDIAKQEYENETTSKIQSFFKAILPILTIALVIINIFWAVNNYSARAEIQKEIQNQIAKYQGALANCEEKNVRSSTMCSVYLSEFTKDNSDLIKYANEQMKLLTEAMNQTIKENEQTQQGLRNKIAQKIINEVKS